MPSFGAETGVFASLVLSGSSGFIYSISELIFNLVLSFSDVIESSKTIFLSAAALRLIVPPFLSLIAFQTRLAAFLPDLFPLNTTSLSFATTFNLFPRLLCIASPIAILPLPGLP